MPFVYFFVTLGLMGFFSSVLMGVTVVGVCRYGNRYRRFFERLKTLGALATIKEMSRIYFGLLNKFLGPNVGFKQRGVLKKSKYFGIYIEHLLLIYWFAATILVLAFRPVEQAGDDTSSLFQAAAFITLLTINVASDAISLLWTKRCIALLVIPKIPLTLRKLLIVLAQDLLVAVALMSVAQFISNGLYAVQIGKPREFVTYLLDIRTAIKPYGPIDPDFSNWQFPGQLVITCTTYIPSLLFYLTCLIILCLKPFYNIAVWIFSLFNIKDAKTQECTPLGYIGSLVGVGGLAVASGKLLFDAWR